MMMGT